MTPLQSANQGITQSNLQATSGSTDDSSIYPELLESDSGIPWALPIEPSTTDRNWENTLQRKIIRRTPSAPELAQSRKRPTIEGSKHPVANIDPRLENASTERWGITYISDNDFRKFMTSYIVWDHPCWAVFDDDDFCKALSGEASELASKLLIMAVLAFALRLYVYFDPKVAHNFSTAHEETIRLWQESIDGKDDSIATAAAGVIVYVLYAGDGVTEEATSGPKNTEDSAPPAYAVAAQVASIKAIRQLLVRREALYGGLGASTLFATPALAVIFDALPTASPASPEYTPSAHMAFIAGLRLLMHVSRSIHIVYYGILGVQQAAARLALEIPIEAEQMFKEAAKAIKHNPWQEKAPKDVSSGWAVDFSRPAIYDDDARLGNLVAKMDSLDAEEDR
ncbi:hypothetical protein MBLNU13_g07104t1 [Cladosporium sp. NU13]